MLPRLMAARWYHACTLTTRFGHNQMVVIGGTDDINKSIIRTIEYYDLTSRPGAWTNDSEFLNKS